MAYIDNFEGMFKTTDELTVEKIILKFFDIDANLNLKTEIPPNALIPLETLEAYAIILHEQGLKKTAKLVTELVRLFKEFMISYDRQGRGEGERMIAGMKEQIKNSGTLARLLGASNSS